MGAILDVFRVNGRLNKPLVFLFFVIAALLLANALLHDPTSGYDANDHQNYVESLASHWRLPTKAESGQYYSPPLPYILPALLTALHTGLWKALKLAQFFNALSRRRPALLPAQALRPPLTAKRPPEDPLAGHAGLVAGLLSQLRPCTRRAIPCFPGSLHYIPIGSDLPPAGQLPYTPTFTWHCPWARHPCAPMGLLPIPTRSGICLLDGPCPKRVSSAFDFVCCTCCAHWASDRRLVLCPDCSAVWHTDRL